MTAGAALGTEEFFDRHPVQVADDLLERELWVSNRRLVITSVMPQLRRDNASWIDRRPLFTDPEVSAYVAPYRASHLLFLRTQPGTCVRIDGVTTRDGEELKRPGQVCRALGLTSERLGTVALQEDAVAIQWLRRN